MSEGVPSPWSVVQRVWSYRGEERANVMRVIAIAVFYVVQLANRHGLNLGILKLEAVESVTAEFHAAVTALTVAWMAVALGALVMMRSRRFPPALKYVTTTIDVVLLSALLLIADGPRSPLVVIYFIVLAGAPLRFSVPLVRYTTFATIAGYIFVVGDAWLRRPELQVPRYQQVIMVLTLGFCGLVLSQLMRAVRDAAESYSARAGEP
ncbi:MAG: hypothetical protein AAGE52_20760 [Myxococcota bacterium]